MFHAVIPGSQLKTEDVYQEVPFDVLLGYLGV